MRELLASASRGRTDPLTRRLREGGDPAPPSLLVILAKAGIQRPPLCSSSSRRRGSGDPLSARHPREGGDPATPSLLVIFAKAEIQRPSLCSSSSRRRGHPTRDPLSARHPREGGDPATLSLLAILAKAGIQRLGFILLCAKQSFHSACGANSEAGREAAKGRMPGVKNTPLALRFSGLWPEKSASADLCSADCTSCADVGIGAIPRTAPAGIAARSRRNAKGTRRARDKDRTEQVTGFPPSRE